MNLLVSALVLTTVTSGGDAFVNNIIDTTFNMQSAAAGCADATDMQCPRSTITFWLYTRSSQNGIQLDVNSLDTQKFEEAPLKIIIHGYTDDKDSASNAILRPYYFAHGEYNIISVDWSPLGKSNCYYQTSMNAPTIGHCVAQFFNRLVSVHKFSSIQLIGHSMGAHISSYASHEMPWLKHLTLLDSALPLYGDDSVLLKSGVAEFIDSYHSNCDVFGRNADEANVNVYFNNGVFQPGCDCDISCSHARAVWYYGESISNPNMTAFPCQGGWQQVSRGECPMPTEDDLVTVGQYINTFRTGTFLMYTNEEAPFFIDPSYYTDADHFESYRKKSIQECPLKNTLFDGLTSGLRLTKSLLGVQY